MFGSPDKKPTEFVENAPVRELEGALIVADAIQSRESATDLISDEAKKVYRAYIAHLKLSVSPEDWNSFVESHPGDELKEFTDMSKDALREFVNGNQEELDILLGKIREHTENRANSETNL